jgi:hypothetical protein
MATQSLQESQQEWTGLGIDGALQAHLLTKIMEIPPTDHKKFLDLFADAGKSLENLLVPQFLLMFNPTYLASLGGINVESQNKLRQLGEAKSQCDINSLLVWEIR